MIPNLRKQFNDAFSPEKYQKLKDTCQQHSSTEIGFRLSESPIFVDKVFQEKLFNAAESIIQQIDSFSAEELNKAIPSQSLVPGDDSHYHFLAIDFGICRNESGELEPQLIELQAFPSLFGFQRQYEEDLRSVYPFLDTFKRRILINDYIEKLRNIIIGNENPENVILLEIFPEQQKTAVDFSVTENFLGIKAICLTKIIKEGRQLFYEDNGRKIRINRIYNRVIFDELDNIPDLKTDFYFTDDVDVTWVTHPNWFFKISKFILPKLNHAYVPKSYFLNEAPDNLDYSRYVLKPLFSFAGSGVNIHPVQEDIDIITDKENYILQKKVDYAPIFEDINGEFSKAEIRLLFGKAEGSNKLEFLVNLVRMTKAEMVNVNFNKKDAIWIGSTMAFFESDLQK
ncbi:hypothetical protein [Elizabethkingia ursingii]|uniref:Uncharacterized protein n=1 Tax=Elizabethkingia ursingii TaxID=1756150 RepID=A0AAJ3NEB6_9FLAO|nr:hypothetical protein [Elizabethkingia ursingii]AQX08446.1 hypothetical protein BBD34_07270 [Elizabethkingia ursingii]OPB78086.1 hypothetical protein BAY32_04045 [Elizabethkingia ursingii]